MKFINKTPYNPMAVKHPEQALRRVSDIGNVYFINYKNSALGTGGVGTTSREMNKIIKDIKFVYYDKKLNFGPIGLNGWNVGLNTKEAEAIHGVYAKLHLWPLLHGIKSNIDSKDIEQHRMLIPNIAEKFAISAHKFAQRSNRRPIYWVNDYTLAPVVTCLREVDPNALIIFSLRTPFGVDQPPNLGNEDCNLVVKSMLSADLVTFHRKSDMSNFICLARHYADSIELGSDYNSTVCMVGRNVHIKVVPMGSNFSYRQDLRKTPRSIEIENEYRLLTKGCTMITGISRFEKSKGLDYELKVFEHLLETHPSLRGTIQFVRFSYMSEQKKDTDYYVQFRKVIDSEVDRINKIYGTSTWIPVIARFDKKLTDEEVTGVLRAADVLFIGSYADGFNHLAMEGIFSQDKISSIRLVLGNVGARDYIKGYYGFECGSIESGANALHMALREKTIIRYLRSYQMSKSKSFSIKRWIIDILYSVTQIKHKEGGI